MKFCEKCNKSLDLHTKPCYDYVVNLSDEWGMARRSEEWKDAEVALRKIVCKEYGHSFFPGPPWTWKKFCKVCGDMPL